MKPEKRMELSSGLFDDYTEADYSNENVLKRVQDFWEANSESESESENDGDDNGDKGPNQKMISFRKLKQKMYQQYDTSIVHKYSTTLDLFVRYIQCYHILYSEAVSYTHLTLPTTPYV